MSSTLHKIADKLAGKDKEHDNPHSSNFGPHSSAAANKVDPRVDSDYDGRNNPSSNVGGYGNTQTTGGYGAQTGPGTTNTNYPGDNTYQSTNVGPHNSNLANKLDPRVDSDRDGRNNPSSNYGGGYGTSNTHTGTTQHHQSTNVGPHSSNLANKLDPRVDSDRDGRNNPTSYVGGHGNTQTSNLGHTTHTGSGGYGTTDTGHDNPRSTNTGPHSSNLLNQLDPRVDSDRDGRNDPSSRVGGYGQTQTTSTGYGAPPSGGYGADSGPGSGPQGYTGTNTGYDDPRSTNTGPHSSNLLNKLDPRVDSDRDGRDNPTSKYGGQGQTQTGTGGVGRY